MKHGSLFSGIGGFDLAAEWAGWENVFHCEWDFFCQKVLKHHFPKAVSYGDIAKTDFTIWRGRVDIITGGFPCQPFSAAGKRLGKEDDRHLWPEMLRAIKEIQPRWVVGENVLGITNWSGGLVFEEVQADLEAEGYEVQPVIIPACAVNAPHRRDRVWFVANRTNSRGKGRTTPDTEGERQPPQQTRATKFPAQVGQGLHGRSSNGQIPVWEKFPTQPPICGRNDGLPDRLDGITFPKWRNESIKAYGNAIVPQVAYQIFKSINQYNEQTPLDFQDTQV